MTTVAKRAFVCGFCSQSGYHDRCPGVVGGLDCTCTFTHGSPCDRETCGQTWAVTS
jgi:hypothetical protein